MGHADTQRHRAGPDCARCGAAFDRWRSVYNHERPREALGMATPASRYRMSPRAMPDTPPLPEYDEGEIIRKVRDDGFFTFRGRTYLLSAAFAGHTIARRPTTKDGIWNVCFASHTLATLAITAETSKTKPVRHVPSLNSPPWTPAPVVSLPVALSRRTTVIAEVSRKGAFRPPRRFAPMPPVA